MVVNQTGYTFESSVISYGSQTKDYQLQALQEFESSVISYGSQTRKEGA